MRSQYTFTGQYDFVIDSKNRINIPSIFRKQLDESDKNRFVITRGIDSCIWIYPLGEWEKIEKELSQLSSLSKVNRTFLRNHLRHAKIVCSDDQGRLILTKNLIEYANILKNITIIGVLNKIEIWDNATLAVSDSEQSIDEEFYEDLSRRVNI
ncbi:MAG: division/cell wall cluster transcriptional repressor MraZ [Candidatus Marinimicrobia bacterium]|jgi:MraZ protein|nr:division/cell wall cluster transcriptional repressor MraZ [Candidatus Neomarinimicrobiota bacterium]MBT3944038.1 division/cell wall cluster transcriptional repressor MraZ [Candidatus Neomarinimicrobiota bacterium]MBT4706960.1 division/cell wall cluster transcriptional repressor MraZ [Candidatus Neomarinimicrobiota bacterium]MBT4926566.1 division/cell wall cluster transcriptional repressor MraZ [Candidatus Neomarinimicrobiota bacterium]MBT5251255.1 division/cell wall cluster transcriptional r